MEAVANIREAIQAYITALEEICSLYPKYESTLHDEVIPKCPICLLPTARFSRWDARTS